MVLRELLRLDIERPDRIVILCQQEKSEGRERQAYEGFIDILDL